jgi:hypothetical protein
MPDTPPYQVVYDDRKTYLFAAVTGPKDSLEISIAFWTEIITEALKNNFKKLLVTEDFKDVVSTIDMYMLVEQLERFGVEDLQVAFVDKEISQFELNKFAETVAVNRGINGRVFKTESEAERWLLEN